MGYFIPLLFSCLVLPQAVRPEDAPVFAIEYDQALPASRETFDEVLKLLHENYYTDVSDAALYEAAIHGMLRRLSPPESPELGKLWKPEAYAPVKERLLGMRISIGIRSTFNSADGSLTVTEVTPGGGSEDKLKVYDRIMRIDGKVLTGMDAADVSECLAGDADSIVKLTVVRGIEILEFEVPRRETPVENLEVAVMPKEVALIEIHQMSSGISEALKKQLLQLQELEIKRLIIDLRGNTGGVFMEGLRVAEQFIPEKGIMLRTREKSGSKRYVSSNATPLKFAIMVVVDENTASAAEIVAAALRDQGLAELVGTRTYGKSVIEKTFTLNNDYRLKFIVNAMTSPRNTSWQSTGLIPDYHAETGKLPLASLRKLSMDDRLKRDVPLNTAWKLLSR